MIRRQFSTPTAFALAFLIPTMIIIAAYTSMSGPSFLDDLDEEWSNWLFQLGIYVGPFLLFLLAGQRSVLLWVIQTALTALVWAYFVWSVFASVAAHAGVDFFAVILMFLGPILTGLTSLMIFKLIDRLMDSKSVG